MNRDTRYRLWRLVLAYRAPIIALLFVLALLARGASTRPKLAEPPATPELPQPTRSLAAKSAPTAAVGASRAPITRTDHLVLFTSSGSYSAEQVRAVAPELETALLYVQERTRMTLLRPINIMFDRRPEACGLDAVAYTHVRTIVIYVCPETSGQRALNVLAHELVHQLAHDHYGDAHLQADLVLSEGLATWGAGRYWLGDAPDFRSFVASNYGPALLPLVSVPRADDPVSTLNQQYYQWAAFVEWILAQHGADALERLYAAERGRQPGSAPYTLVLGLPQAQIEENWQLWLSAVD